MKQNKDLNNKIVKFYASQTAKKRSISISSTHKKTSFNQRLTSTQSPVPQTNPEQLKAFFRNQKLMAFDSPGLEYSELPNNLKLHFRRAPSPPPQLKIVQYTNEVVPFVPVRFPKRKRGQMLPWVYQQMGWNEQQNLNRRESTKSISLSPNKKRYQSTDKCYKSKTITRASSQNPGKYQLIKRQTKQKPYQYYNSLRFFRNLKDGKIDEVQADLIQTPLLVNDFDDLKMTPLHWASKQGHAQILKLLCQRFKANINIQDNYGRTPLYLASQNKRTDCIYRLFVQGAQILIQANNKKSAKDVASDLYTKYALQKIEQIKKILQTKKIPKQLFKQKLEADIRATLDPTSAYF